MGDTYPNNERLKIPDGSIILEAIEERRSLVVGSLVAERRSDGLLGRITEFFMMGKEPWYFCRVRTSHGSFVDRGVRDVELAGAIDRLGDLVRHDRKKSKRRYGRRARRRHRR